MELQRLGGRKQERSGGHKSREKLRLCVGLVFGACFLEVKDDTRRTWFMYNNGSSVIQHDRIAKSPRENRVCLHPHLRVFSKRGRHQNAGLAGLSWPKTFGALH